MRLAPIYAIVIAVAHSLNAFGALYVRSRSSTLTDPLTP
jgi:hypothetical protein